MNDKKQKLSFGKIAGVVFLVVLFAAFCYMIIYNLRNNNDFLKTSAANCISISIAVGISFFLVQKKNDKRKQREIMLDLIYKLQTKITDERVVDLTGQDIEEIHMRNRDISNRIHTLQSLQAKFGIVEEVKFVAEKYDEYTTFIGNYISDLDYLAKSRKALERPISLIDSKLTDIAIKLFD